jgi:hypothetical protein
MSDFEQEYLRLKEEIYQQTIERGRSTRLYDKLKLPVKLPIPPFDHMHERGEFLESFYMAMRWIDDVVDGDHPLPEGVENRVVYAVDRQAFAKNPQNPTDPADFILAYAYEMGKRFGQDFRPEAEAIIGSMLFDARRAEDFGRDGTYQIFPAAELGHYFHELDITGTVRGMLKVYAEDRMRGRSTEEALAAKEKALWPLSMATRIYYDIRDIIPDLRQGFVNLTKEEYDGFGLDSSTLAAAAQGAISSELDFWRYAKAQEGQRLLSEHKASIRGQGFGLVSRLTFPVVYIRGARECFDQVCTGKYPSLATR